MKMSTGRKLFLAVNYLFLILAALLCLFPLLHIFAVSLSDRSVVAAGYVKLWPMKFTLASYHYVFEKKAFWRSIGISAERITLGTSVNMLFTILAAYPLSKEKSFFRWRTLYAWFFVFTILFNGGLIPGFMVVKELGLMDSIWALILPGAVPVFYVVLLLNFFRGLPKEMEEAAYLDGAGHWTVLWKIYLPTSAPALATIALFSLVGHWNEWFSGLLYMNRPEHYPLQTYLQTVVSQMSANAVLENLSEFDKMNDRTLKAAQIFFGTLPILLVYPFLQKYFTKGIVIGSVKG